MRIIIAGSRTFNNYSFLVERLDRILSNLDVNDIEIVSGTADGADELGERYAVDRGLRIKRMAAQWHKYGRKAGPVRNRAMAEYAAAEKNGGCVVFWDGYSNGTKSMIKYAKEYNLKLRVIIF